jgi:hypothetical protein
MLHDQKFYGNYLYQSHNAFKCLTLSRRDDLISLVYMLVYYFTGKQEWVDGLDDDESYFGQI